MLKKKKKTESSWILSLHQDSGKSVGFLWYPAERQTALKHTLPGSANKYLDISDSMVAKKNVQKSKSLDRLQ